MLSFSYDCNHDVVSYIDEVVALLASRYGVMESLKMDHSSFESRAGPTSTSKGTTNRMNPIPREKRQSNSIHWVSLVQANSRFVQLGGAIIRIHGKTVAKQHGTTLNGDKMDPERTYIFSWIDHVSEGSFSSRFKAL